MTISLSQKEKIWDDILANIQEKIEDRHVFDNFFSNTKVFKVEGDLITVITETSLAASLLSTNSKYQKIINDAIEEVTETNYKVKFISQDDIKGTKSNEKSDKKSFFQSCSLNPKYTFDTFVVGSCNKEAVQAALFITSNPGASFNPLFIYSKSGLGKTHLLHAIGNYIKEKKPFNKVLYITTDAFIDEFVKYIRGNQQDESLKDFMRDVDVLLVDDIQFLSEKNKTAEMFFNVFNTLITNNKQIVLTSDRAPNELKGLEDRLVSRFNMGLSVSINNPDTETCIEILKMKIESNGLNIDNFDYDGIVYLAENFSKNVRELEGALNRLLFYTISTKKTNKIDTDTIKESLNALSGNRNKNSQLTNQKIIEGVGEYYNLTETQITSKNRTSQIALARQIAMYLCRAMLNTSYVQIGKIFERDHSTVMTSVDKISTMLKTDNNLITAIEQIKKSLK